MIRAPPLNEMVPKIMKNYSHFAIGSLTNRSPPSGAVHLGFSFRPLIFAPKMDERKENFNKSIKAPASKTKLN